MHLEYKQRCANNSKIKFKPEFWVGFNLNLGVKSLKKWCLDLDSWNQEKF